MLLGEGHHAVEGGAPGPAPEGVAKRVEGAAKGRDGSAVVVECRGVVAKIGTLVYAGVAEGDERVVDESDAFAGAGARCGDFLVFEDAPEDEADEEGFGEKHDDPESVAGDGTAQ
jgi:hypothetical protein